MTAHNCPHFFGQPTGLTSIDFHARQTHGDGDKVFLPPKNVLNKAHTSPAHFFHFRNDVQFIVQHSGLYEIGAAFP